MQFACPSQNITNCLHCDPTAGLNNRDGKKRKKKDKNILNWLSVKIYSELNVKVTVIFPKVSGVQIT